MSRRDRPSLCYAQGYYYALYITPAKRGLHPKGSEVPGTSPAICRTRVLFLTCVPRQRSQYRGAVTYSTVAFLVLNRNCLGGPSARVWDLANMFDLLLEPRQLLLEEWRGTIPITHCENCCGESLLVPEGLLGILCPSHRLEAVMCSQQQLSSHRKGTIHLRCCRCCPPTGRTEAPNSAILLPVQTL